MEGVSNLGRQILRLQGEPRIFLLLAFLDLWRREGIGGLIAGIHNGYSIVRGLLGKVAEPFLLRSVTYMLLKSLRP